jgi:hypothetical protein
MLDECLGSDFRLRPVAVPDLEGNGSAVERQRQEGEFIVPVAR